MPSFLLNFVLAMVVTATAAAQVTITNKDVKEAEIRTIPLIKPLPTASQPHDPAAPPGPRGTNPRPAYNANTWQHNSESQEQFERVEPIMPSGPENARERLGRMMANIAIPEDFDLRRYSGVRQFTGDLSIQTSSLPEGNYCLVFCTDSLAAYRAQGSSASMRISRAGRASNDSSTVPVKLSGDVYNFSMARSGSVSFVVSVTNATSKIEGYVAYAVVPLHKDVRLKMTQ